MRTVSPDHLDTPIHVAAGILTDAEGRVLVQRRPDHVHVGGLWEFPGGKRHPGESRRDALDRELEEELGVQVNDARPLIRVRHDYPEKTVVLDVWRVSSFRGVPEPREGQPLEWVLPSQLPALEMPPADGPIVNAVRLPEVCLVTADEPADPGAFLERLERRLMDGIRLVQLRVRRRVGELESLTRRAATLCERHGAWLVLNDDPERAVAWGAHGVHLNRERLRASRGRPVPQDLWLSSVCHDVEELALASKLGADFVLASPVLPTPSHPGAATLGFEGLAALCESAAMPVFALGGLGEEHLQLAWYAGAQGVAGIRGFW